MTEAVKRLRQEIPGREGDRRHADAGATHDRGRHGSPEQDEKRTALNDFIRNSGGVFDGVVDFEKATLDRATGGLRAEFVPDSTIGGPGDGLHPNRAGYLAMGDGVDLGLLRPPAAPRRTTKGGAR